MCWTYYTQTICTTCRAIQPGVCALIEHRNPDCEKPCPAPWPEGQPEENPKLGYVDSSQCSFCARISEPLFVKEKAGQEDFVRGELERMRTLFSDRAEEKRKRKGRRLMRKKKVAGGEQAVGGEEAHAAQEGDSREIDEQETSEREADEQADDGQETAEQEGDGTRRTTRHLTRSRWRV